MFENSYFFYLFLLIPILALIFVFDILIQRKRAKSIAGKNISKIIPYYTEGQKWLRILFYLFGISLAIIAIARPKWGVETIEASVKGRDILVILDTSYSMAASDVAPSRLDSAKRGISELLEIESGDRFGLMVFSGESELIVPITHDYAAVGFFMESIYPGMLSKSGTNIGEAINTGIESFDDREPRNKMILLITDGEDLEGPYYQMLKKAKESGIKIFTVGIGTSNGEPIPIRNSRGEIESYVKDESGKHVISRLNEKRLIEIANTTGGSYLKSVNKKGELRHYIESISSIETKEQKDLKYEQMKERYDIFLLPALIFFAIGFMLDLGRVLKISDKRLGWLIGKNMIIMLLSVGFVVISPSVKLSSQEVDNSADTKQIADNSKKFGDINGGFWGNKSFKKEKYSKALDQYAQAINYLKGNALSKLYYNMGNTYYKMSDYENASRYFESASLFAKEDALKSKVYYNQGLVAFKGNNFQVAAELFKKSLECNEDDDNARYNYQIAQKMAEMTQQQDNQQQQQQEQNENNQDQQDQEQQQQQPQQDNQNKEEQEQKEFSEDDIQKMLEALDEKEKNENKDKAMNDKKNKKMRGKYW